MILDIEDETNEEMEKDRNRMSEVKQMKKSFAID